MAVITAGLYPHVAVLKPGRTNLSCRNEKRVKIHISSLNFKQGGGRGGGGGGSQGRAGGELPTWMVYQEAVRGYNVVKLQVTTPTSPCALTLLCCDMGNATAALAAQDAAKSAAATQRKIEQVREECNTSWRASELPFRTSHLTIPVLSLLPPPCRPLPQRCSKSKAISRALLQRRQPLNPPPLSPSSSSRASTSGSRFMSQGASLPSSKRCVSVCTSHSSR